MGRPAFNTLEAARRTLARFIREYKQTPDTEREHAAFRNVVYAFSILLSFFKAETDADLLQRVEALEKLVKEGGYRNAQKPN